MEFCDKCGEIIKESKWMIKRIEGEPYCSKCYEKVTDGFYPGD